VSKTVILFNDKGKELSTVQTTPQGKLISGVKNKYDERGNLIEKVYKDFYSKTVTYTYDENDLLTTQELYDDSGLLLRKNMYEYDDDGNVITEQTYEMDTSRGGRDKHFGTRYEYEFGE
jgi:YD repeat-containing protein